MSVLIKREFQSRQKRVQTRIRNTVLDSSVKDSLTGWGSLECLPDDLSGLTEESCAPLDCRYDAQIAVFGRDFQKKLESEVQLA
jgi:hypothetical protein